MFTVHPIAVGEVLSYLASHLWCLAVRPSLSHIFLPYSQIGVGIPGGLEGAIYIICHLFLLMVLMTLLKVEMKNAFNECNCSLFLLVCLKIFLRFLHGLTCKIEVVKFSVSLFLSTGGKGGYESRLSSAA